MSNPKQMMSIDSSLVKDIRHLIDCTKQRVAGAVNAEISMLYWQIGNRINNEVLKGKRAEYGKHILETVSTELTRYYDRGWSQKQLLHCRKLADIFRDPEIVSTLCRQLSWSHLKTLIYEKDSSKGASIWKCAQWNDGASVS